MTEGKHRKKKRKLNIGRLAILLLVLAALCFGGLYLKYSNDLKAVQSTSEEVIFSVAEGSTAKTVTADLQKAGLVRNADSAYIFAKLKHYTDIKKGNYALDKSWDVKTILAELNNSNSAIVDASSVTIVEGDWAKDTANKIAAVTNVSSEELMNLWNDETFIRSVMEKYPFLTEDIFNSDVRVRLEGYLCPDTYLFYKETTAEDVTLKILDQSLNIYNQYAEQIKSSGYSISQIYTLASIVQYEASKTDDMKAIAGVFYNRLAIDMPLQSSVTVCYAIDIDKQNDDWRNCEFNGNFESPYNTYKYNGLPPGPILNPGTDALNAVLNPDHNSYYYFMADVCGDGTVHYAETLEEHEANVKKYLSDTSCLN
ncbi:MAG: endolytic transglycosylase MltG [Erysipelotrichia bacterium]|nr:endolytic transglycosylase MltG [Erysipelotrichia bacterium]